MQLLSDFPGPTWCQIRFSSKCRWGASKACTSMRQGVGSSYRERTLAGF